MPEIAIGADLRNATEIAGALEALTRINVGQLRGGMAWPGIYASGARYARETPGDVERWQSIRDLASSGAGDCEDLACARAAEIRVSGRKARAIVVRVPSGYHAVVQHWNGRIEDPSARLGMLGEGVSGMASTSKAERRRRRRARFLSIARKALQVAKQAANTPEGQRALQLGRAALVRALGS